MQRRDRLELYRGLLDRIGLSWYLGSYILGSIPYFFAFYSTPVIRACLFAQDHHYALQKQACLTPEFHGQGEQERLYRYP